MGKSIIDLMGKRFGYLTVIKRVGTKFGYALWLCKCDCGNEKEISGNNLRKGNTKSCGCYRKETVAIRSKGKSPKNIKDLTGKRFGRLVVIERKGSNKNSHSLWLCKCDCGKEVIIIGICLTSENTKSCGCFNHDNHTLPFGEAAKRTIYRSYIKHAEERNLSFELSFEQFLELSQKNCYYCGLEPSNINKSNFNNGDFIYNGIDRVDNTKGYTIENCVSSCRPCNIAKADMAHDEFLSLAERIHQNHFEESISVNSFDYY
jgi:hypothetical protein